VSIVRTDTCQKDAPFVPQQNLFNLEREVRVAFRAMNDDKWIADGLRHGFATYFRALKHYAKSIPLSELDNFWHMTPAVVLASPLSGNG